MYPTSGSFQRDFLQAGRLANPPTYATCRWRLEKNRGHQRPNHIKQKDINDMVLSNIDVMSVLKSNTYSGLKAKVKFNNWKKI